MKMEINNKILIGVILVIALIVGGYLIFNSSEAAVVSAQGQITLTVQPDQVSINLNAQAKDTTAQGAKDKQAKISDDVLTALVKLGFERKEIQTQSYNIYPEYNYNSGGQKITGYIASQQIIIKTKDFSKVSGVVDESVNVGALINGINFELTDAKQNEYKAQALKAASEDAKSKAEATASGLGKKIGSLVSVESSDFNYRPWVYYATADSMGGSAEAKSAALQIAPTDQDVSASVSVKYKLKAF